MKKIKLMYILLGLLVATQVYSMLEIKNLQSELQRNKNDMTYLEDRVSGNINEIYGNVDRKMTEYTGLVLSCNYEIGKFNQSTLTVPITFTVQPKTLTDTTTVQLSFDGEKIELQRSGSKFSATQNFAVSTEIFPTIMIVDQGTEHFEQNNNLQIDNLVDSVFPSVGVRFEGESSYSDGEPYNYIMKGVIRTNEISADANQYYKNEKYIISLDDTVLKSYEISDLERIRLEINDKFELKRGQKLVGKFIATDKDGNVYEQVVFSNGGFTEEKNTRSITAPDGRVIYKGAVME
ncbi:MAG: hypothetical protein RR053_01340 [Evtepia sp.]